MAPVVLIPSLNPLAGPLVRLVAGLGASFPDVVVVDDGSDARFGPTFRSLAGAATVLGHPRNKGKGAALKTGFAHIGARFPGRGVVTVDDDGQHAVEDVAAVAGALGEAGPGGVVLGQRDLAGAPLPSRAGGRLAALAVDLLFGGGVADTQSGLRGVGAGLLGWADGIRGERFEYETLFLLRCLRRGVPLLRVPIRTIYAQGGASRFRRWGDSWAVAGAILGDAAGSPAP